MYFLVIQLPPFPSCIYLHFFLSFILFTPLCLLSLIFLFLSFYLPLLSSFPLLFFLSFIPFTPLLLSSIFLSSCIDPLFLAFIFLSVFAFHLPYNFHVFLYSSFSLFLFFISFLLLLLIFTFVSSLFPFSFFSISFLSPSLSFIWLSLLSFFYCYRYAPPVHFLYLFPPFIFLPSSICCNSFLPFTFLFNFSFPPPLPLCLTFFFSFFFSPLSYPTFSTFSASN